jgi:hypothetical protein
MTTEEKLEQIIEKYITLFPESDAFLSISKDVYNLAIEDAARAAKVGETSRLQAGAGYSRRVTKPTVDKKSILKLKLKL